MHEVIYAVTHFQFMTQELIKHKLEGFKGNDRLCQGRYQWQILPAR